MIRVLQIVGGLNRGGLETFVLNVYKSIDKDKTQFDFLIWNDCYDYCEEIESLGGRVYKIRNRHEGLKTFSKDLDDFFREHANEYVAIHYHAPNLSIIEPLIYAKKYGIKKRIIHSHSSGISGSKIHYFIHFINRFRITKLATNYLGCSDKSLKWMYGKTSAKKQSLLIKNGIDSNKFKFDEEARLKTRRDLNIPDDNLVIGHIGRFCRVKNHSFLIDIFKEIIKVRPNSILLMVGSGPLMDDIKRKTDYLNLSDRVIFTGLRSDIKELLCAMDTFVMPSFIEGLPMTLVEAQATGLSILCSNNVSKDAILSSNFKFLSIKESPTMWANEIIKLNEENRCLDRKNGVVNIKRDGFDIQETADFLSNYYIIK